MSNLIGRKVKGWKFENGLNGIGYLSIMDNYIGLEGEIVSINESFPSVRVQFYNDGQNWNYPLSQVHEHLIPTKVEQMYDEVEAKLNSRVEPDFFDKVVDECIDLIKSTLKEKAKEYMRNNDALHNFNVGSRMTGETREKVLFGMALKHNISLADMRNDIEQGRLPSTELVHEKYKDAINYLILEKASILDRIEKQKY